MVATRVVGVSRNPVERRDPVASGSGVCRLVDPVFRRGFGLAAQGAGPGKSLVSRAQTRDRPMLWPQRPLRPRLTLTRGRGTNGGVIPRPSPGNVALMVAACLVGADRIPVERRDPVASGSSVRRPWTPSFDGDSGLLCWGVAGESLVSRAETRDRPMPWHQRSGRPRHTLKRGWGYNTPTYTGTSCSMLAGAEPIEFPSKDGIQWRQAPACAACGPRLSTGIRACCVQREARKSPVSRAQTRDRPILRRQRPGRPRLVLKRGRGTDRDAKRRPLPGCGVPMFAACLVGVDRIPVERRDPVASCSGVCRLWTPSFDGDPDFLRTARGRGRASCPGRRPGIVPCFGTSARDGPGSR